MVVYLLCSMCVNLTTLITSMLAGSSLATADKSARSDNVHN